MNKKGVLAYVFIYGLIFLFAMVALYIVYDQAIEGYLVPAADNLVSDSDPNKVLIQTQNNEYLSFFKFIPFFILALILLYWIIETLINRSKQLPNQ